MMSKKISCRRVAGVLLGCWLAATGAAWAEKPEWAGQGNGHGKKEERHDREGRDSARGGHNAPKAGTYLGADQREVLRQYYGPMIASGKCPPGLAKKDKGCQPPGQAKKWRVGQPLPAGTVIYPLPADLRHRLGSAPEGHELVRVGSDILMIMVGTSMVIDAIEDLSR